MSRNPELAKIHIAKKDLGLDEDIYRTIIRDIGKAKSGSAADLSALGRSKVLEHFKARGWKPKSKVKSTNKGAGRVKPNGLASDSEIRLIRHLWLRLHTLGIVRDSSETALRRWLKAATRRYHPQNAGYEDVNFLGVDAAAGVIEQLKKWALRHGHAADELITHR